MNCAAADAAWHADNVSRHCTGSDGGSGLASAGDSSFNLTTSVADGAENNNASTDSRSVSDAVGHTVVAGPISGNKVDRKAPSVSCGSPDGAWHAADVLIACNASDGGSGLALSGDASFNLSTNVPGGTETSSASTNSHSVSDAVGHSSTAGPVSGNKVDKKGPALTITCPADPVVKDSSANASWTASDGGSGLATPASGSVALNTSFVGTQTANAPTAKDNVGNETNRSCSYSVIFGVHGFFQPVDMSKLNVAQAGSAIPVKFDLSGNQGLNIFTAGYPLSVKIACDSSALLDDIEETVTAGGSSLNYDAGANAPFGQYIYVWKTDKAWSSSCRRIDVKFLDGTVKSATFQFKK